MRRVAKYRVVLHPPGGQGQGRTVADTAQRGNRSAPLARAEAPPELGARHVRLEIVHVDAVLAEQRQDVLGRLHQLRGGPVLEGAAQRVEPGLVLGVFREIQRPNEIGPVQRRCQLFGWGAQRQGHLLICPARGMNRRIGAVHGGGRGGADRARRGKRGQGGFGLALGGGDLVQLPGHAVAAGAGVGLARLGDIGLADGVDGALQAPAFLAHHPCGARRHRRNPDHRHRHENREHRHDEAERRAGLAAVGPVHHQKEHRRKGQPQQRQHKGRDLDPRQPLARRGIARRRFGLQGRRGQHGFGISHRAPQEYAIFRTS